MLVSIKNWIYNLLPDSYNEYRYYENYCVAELQSYRAIRQEFFWDEYTSGCTGMLLTCPTVCLASEMWLEVDVFPSFLELL